MSEALESLWEDLLQYIENGLVLPIIGQDIANVTIAGKTARLYDHLADRLASELNLPRDGSREIVSLSDVAEDFIARGGRKLKVHLALNEILHRTQDYPVPDLLLKLAAIQPFQLFVTTTFDLMPERALNQVRFGGKDKTVSLAYSPDDTRDLRESLISPDRPTVFHLLGRVSPKPHYAVTEDDILEFVHSLQGHAQNRLFDEFRDRELLFIGCAFPDWLTRFLVRTARGKPQDLQTSMVVADDSVHSERGLVRFLERLGSRTAIFPGTVAQFVNELHDRWIQRQAAAPRPNDAGDARDAIRPGSVFLSYASEDVDAARAIRDALEAAGLDVWFDKDDLELGDRYTAKIRGGIARCALFVPIVSRHVTTQARRFFRLEWNEAQEVAKQLPPSSRFVIPVVIDDTSYAHENIPDTFRKLHWTSLPKGQPTEEFVKSVQTLYRDYQRAAGAAL